MFKEIYTVSEHFSSYEQGSDVWIDNEVLDETFIEPNNTTPNKVNPSEHAMSAINASLQYCFWYGDSSYRPFNSADLDDLVADHFKGLYPEELQLHKNTFIEKIKKSGITMLPERIQSIQEVFKLDFVKYNKLQDNPGSSLTMLYEIPTFQKDVFKKKALYGIARTYTERGILDQLNIPVPADYRIPQALNFLGIVKYSPQLQKMVSDGVLLPENSKYEVQIRSNAIIAVRDLARKNNITENQVDQYLFYKARELKTPHHLTYTTNY